MHNLMIRPARIPDAPGMSDVLMDLYHAGLRHARPSDESFALIQYITHPDRLLCLVAEGKDGQVLGFQSLKRATPGNPYGTPLGWGIIGTHIRPSATRQGIGRAFFDQTRHLAQLNQLPAIEAGIGVKNDRGLAYYEAMGFRTYKTTSDNIYKSYDL